MENSVPGKWKKLVPVVIGVGVIVFLSFLLDPHPGQSTPVRPSGNRPLVSQLNLKQLDGGSWSLADHRGQVVLVNFWATWCPPCRAETPGLVKLANAYASKGLEIVGVTMDDGGPDEVRQFVKDYHIPYPILLPTQSLVGQIDSLPTTLLIDRQGRVAKTYVGSVTESTFQTDVTQLLAEAR